MFSPLPLICQMTLAVVLNCAVISQEADKANNAIKLPAATSHSPLAQLPATPIVATINGSSCIIDKHSATNYSLKIHEHIQ